MDIMSDNKDDMYGKLIKIFPGVKINDEQLKHVHGKIDQCNNKWCLRDLCDCSDDVHWYQDYESCPKIPKGNHEHERVCPECDRLAWKESIDMIGKALRETEDQIMKQLKDDKEVESKTVDELIKELCGN